MKKDGTNLKAHSGVLGHSPQHDLQIEEFLSQGYTIITLPNIEKLESVRDIFLGDVNKLLNIHLSDIEELREHCQKLRMEEIEKIRSLKLRGITSELVGAMGNNLNLFSSRSIYLQRFPHLNLNVAKKTESVTVSHNEVMAGHAPNTFACWVPFHNTDDESGLYFLGQNQTMDLIKKSNNFEDVFPSDKKISSLLPECLKVNFGQAVVFNVFVFHGAYHHNKQKARISIDFRFQDIKYPLFEKNLEYFGLFNT